MKIPVCELCGGKNLSKQNGVFVCQECGTTYSVEEARKLMMDIDSTINVRGTVQVDRSSEIHNRMQNAIAEYNAGHQDRAIALFNDILNIDFENVTAIIYKAASDGFLSSLANNRLAQTAFEMCRAVDIAAAKNKDSVAFTEAIRPAIVEMTRICEAIATMCEKRKREEESEIRSLQFKAESAADDAKHAMWHGPIYEVDIHNANAEMYSNQAKERSVKLNSLISQNVQITSNALVSLAEKIMSIMENSETSYDDFGREMRDLVDTTNRLRNLSYSVRINKLPDRISAMRKRLDAGNENHKRTAIRLYWEQHAEQKQALEAEQQVLLGQQSELQTEIDKIQSAITAIENRKNEPVPAAIEVDEYKAKRKAAENQMDSLGLFKIKERKQLRDEIDKLSDRISGLWDVINQQKDSRNDEITKEAAPLREELEKWLARIQPVNSRLNEIHEELTKDR